MSLLFKYYELKEMIGSKNQYLNTLKTEYEIKRMMEGNKRKGIRETILEKISKEKNKITTPTSKKDINDKTTNKEEPKTYDETKEEIKENKESTKDSVKENKIKSEEELVKEPKDEIEEPDLSKYQEMIEKNDQIKQAATGVNKGYKDTDDIIIDIQNLIEMRKNKK